jgi:hypothetical protein
MSGSVRVTASGGSVSASVSETRVDVSVSSPPPGGFAVTGGSVSVESQTQPQSVRASGGSVQANILGGFGPQGPAGPAGPAGGVSYLAELLDVSITSAATGDVLRFDGSAWTGYEDRRLTDGGAF